MGQRKKEVTDYDGKEEKGDFLSRSFNFSHISVRVYACVSIFCPPRKPSIRKRASARVDTPTTEKHQNADVVR